MPKITVSSEIPKEKVPDMASETKQDLPQALSAPESSSAPRGALPPHPALLHGVRLTCPEGIELHPLCGSQCCSPAWPGCPSSSSASPACRSSSSAPLGTPELPSLQDRERKREKEQLRQGQAAPDTSHPWDPLPTAPAPELPVGLCSPAPRFGSSQCPAVPSVPSVPSSCPSRVNPCLCPIPGFLQLRIASGYLQPPHLPLQA